MKTVVLNKTHLNANGKMKEVNDLDLTDFKVPMYVFYQANKVMYINKNRSRVLKKRIK